MQKHLAPYTNRIQLADIQLFYAVQDTVADVCKIPLSHTLCKNLGIFIEDYVVICRIHASNVLFMPVNNLFQGAKQSVSTCETICFEARNKVFQGGKLFVSYA